MVPSELTREGRYGEVISTFSVLKIGTLWCPWPTRRYQHLMTFSMCCTWPYQATCCILKESFFCNLFFPLTKGLGHIVEPPLPFFFFEKDSFLLFFLGTLWGTTITSPSTYCCLQWHLRYHAVNEVFSHQGFSFHRPFTFTLAHLAQDDPMSSSSIFGLLKGHGP